MIIGDERINNQIIQEMWIEWSKRSSYMDGEWHTNQVIYAIWKCDQDMINMNLLLLQSVVICTI